MMIIMIMLARVYRSKQMGAKADNRYVYAMVRQMSEIVYNGKLFNDDINVNAFAY